jgi:uncharacterized protein (DUF924 family)
MIHQVEEILRFWFGDPNDPDHEKQKKVWFIQNPAFDQKIKTRFLSYYQLAAENKLDFWQYYPESCLALIIILDQFPRNLFRGQPQAFATDEKALKVANYAINQKFDQQLLSVQRAFIYLPFEHSENLTDQHRSVELFTQLRNDPNTASMFDYAIAHFNIIQQFGRFPHRNNILGRPSTPEELEFLTQPGSSF